MPYLRTESHREKMSVAIQSKWKDVSYRSKFLKYPRDQYPREVAAFTRMQRRVKEGYSTTSWEMTTKGFLSFLKHLGPMPLGMKCCTLGRKNHSKGYLPGNCLWQERSDNTAELWTRPEFRAKISATMSERMKGNQLYKNRR